MTRYAVILILASAVSAYSQDPEHGKKIFTDNCAICHTIGKGRLIGPDLAGIGERREKDWVLAFVSNSGEMIASGDKTAVQLFEEFNRLTMPAHDFSEAELENLYAYLVSEGGQQAVAAVAEPEPVAEVPQTLEANAQPPSWFIAAISFIGGVVVVLLVVIFMLLKMVRQLAAVPMKGK